MRAPEALRPAVLSLFSAGQEDWILIVQALVMRMEGLRPTVREMGERWGVSKSKAATLMKTADDVGRELGVLPDSASA